MKFYGSKYGLFWILLFGYLPITNLVFNVCSDSYGRDPAFLNEGWLIFLVHHALDISTALQITHSCIQVQTFLHRFQGNQRFWICLEFRPLLLLKVLSSIRKPYHLYQRFSKVPFSLYDISICSHRLRNANWNLAYREPVVLSVWIPCPLENLCLPQLKPQRFSSDLDKLYKSALVRTQICGVLSFSKNITHRKRTLVAFHSPQLHGRFQFEKRKISRMRQNIKTYHRRILLEDEEENQVLKTSYSFKESMQKVQSSIENYLSKLNLKNFFFKNETQLRDFLKDFNRPERKPDGSVLHAARRDTRYHEKQLFIVAAMAGTVVAVIYVIQRSQKGKGFSHYDVSFYTSSTISSASLSTEESFSTLDEYWNKTQNLFSPSKQTHNYITDTLGESSNFPSSTRIFRLAIAQHLLTDYIIPYPMADFFNTLDSSSSTGDLSNTSNSDSFSSEKEQSFSSL